MTTTIDNPPVATGPAGASAMGSEPEAPAPRFAGLTSGWPGFFLRRLGGLLLTFGIAVVGTFLILPLIPGDPAASAAGQDADLARIEQVREELGLNDPLAQRFVDYVAGIFTGDWGTSFAFNAPVLDVMAARLPMTLVLAFGALVIIMACAIPLGVAVAVLTQNGRNRRLDSAFGFVTAFVSAIPPYVMATLLVLLFAVWFSLLPPAFSSRNPGPTMILPLLALAFPAICSIARIVRRETAVVLGQDYMRTARGWRVAPVKAYLKYAVPNLLTSTLTLSGMIIIGLLGGAITVETVFNVPGLGLGIVTAVQRSDYALIQGIVIVLAMIAAVITLVVDIVLGLVDPRVIGAGDE